tara:strand:+ start:46 stop:237 length:192 start_codon:yes stop_codon:yes gene_type:complete
MTAKEKAMEIAMKFDKDGQTDNAVKCALICVDEILQVLWHNHEKNSEKMYRYYKKVKQEINKI